MFNELFNNPDADRKRLIPLPEQETPRQGTISEQADNMNREGQQELQDTRQNERQAEISGRLIDMSSLGAVDIFSILMEEDHTHEYIDPAFRYGRRKKKKKGR